MPIADALLPARNHGVVLSGTAASDNVSWAEGASNNWIDSDESFSDTSNQFVGRVTWAPAIFQNENHLLHVGLGLRSSDTKQPVRARSEPEFDNAPLYVDTGSFSADDQVAYNLEAYWRSGPYILGFEYIGADVDSPQSGDPYFSGYHVTGSWALTGETRAYRKRSGTFDPLPGARPVNQGRVGHRRVGCSLLKHRPDRRDGGELDICSLGVN